MPRSYEELKKAGVNVDFKTYQYMGVWLFDWRFVLGISGCTISGGWQGISNLAAVPCLPSCKPAPVCWLPSCEQ